MNLLNIHLQKKMHGKIKEIEATITNEAATHQLELEVDYASNSSAVPPLK